MFICFHFHSNKNITTNTDLSPALTAHPCCIYCKNTELQLDFVQSNKDDSPPPWAPRRYENTTKY